MRIDRVLWAIGDKETVRPDVIKRRSYKERTIKPNVFFRDVYANFNPVKRLRAEDHTGQLNVDDRINREERFRAEWYKEDDKTELDVDQIRRDSISALFCSPTMELGVDIGGLSVVHMRNAPPNPANYASDQDVRAVVVKERWSSLIALAIHPTTATTLISRLHL